MKKKEPKQIRPETKLKLAVASIDEPMFKLIEMLNKGEELEHRELLEEIVNEYLHLRELLVKSKMTIKKVELENKLEGGPLWI